MQIDGHDMKSRWQTGQHIHIYIGEVATVQGKLTWDTGENEHTSLTCLIWWLALALALCIAVDDSWTEMMSDFHACMHDIILPRENESIPCTWRT